MREHEAVNALLAIAIHWRRVTINGQSTISQVRAAEAGLEGCVDLLIRVRREPTPYKIRSVIEVSCDSCSGVAMILPEHVSVSHFEKMAGHCLCCGKPGFIDIGDDGQSPSVQFRILKEHDHG